MEQWINLILDRFGLDIACTVTSKSVNNSVNSNVGQMHCAICVN